MAPEGGRPPKKARNAPPASSVPSLVKDLVDQFDRPLDFFRELIQNSIDAGSNRIDVSIGRDGEISVIRVEDDGEGMDEFIIDNYLLVLFRSSKEDDFTKIGKFGIGFVSVFSLRPEQVRVFTARNGESWRLDFPSYRRYEKYKLSSLREGTLVEIRKKQSEAEFQALVKESRQTISYWCKHSEVKIFFREGENKAEILNEPFELPETVFAYNEEGTEIRLAFSGEDPPFFGFYNRGLTLKEGRKPFFSGVSFKAKSRYLEHTLTRDSVIEDQNYQKLMAIVKRLVDNPLPDLLRKELEGISSGFGSMPIGALRLRWAARMPFLKAISSGFFSRRSVLSWPIFPALSGKAVSAAQIRAGLKKSPGGKVYFAEAPSRIIAELEWRGAFPLPEGPWLEFLASLLAVECASVAEFLIFPKLLSEDSLPGGLRSFLVSLRALDARTGPCYRGILCADLGTPNDNFFVTQTEPGSLSEVGEKSVSSLFWLRPKRWALLNAAHPSLADFVRVHPTRPGFAAFLCLKMMRLHDGESPDGRKGEFPKLAEEVEGRLLEEALKMDEEAAGR